MDGVRINGDSGSVDTGIRGREFMIAHGAVDDLKIDAINVEDGPFRNHMYNSGTVWKFNSPHSSHMDGAWERIIRRRVHLRR
jgi:hypothetical protein